MNINELFETIQDEIGIDGLNGEFLLDGKKIIWSYKISEDGDDLDEMYDDDEMFSFGSTSTEELLLDAYQDDLDKLQEFLDDIGETDNWKIGDNEIRGSRIKFIIS